MGHLRTGVHRRDAGIGTIAALMLLYAIILLAVWLVLFAAFFLLGIPLGPDRPVRS